MSNNFYLNTELPPAEREYMWVEAWMIPDDIMEEYDIEIINGRALVEITNAIYGLPQAGRLSYNKLKQHLEDDGYLPCKLTPGLFRHIPLKEGEWLCVCLVLLERLCWKLSGGK